MNFTKIQLLSLTGRKFLLKTTWLLILYMFFLRLEAKPIAPQSGGQHGCQIQPDTEAFVHEWLYNYYEKPTRFEIEMAAVKLKKMLDAFQRSKTRYSTEEQWLKDIFYQVQKKYLKRYQSFSTIPDLFAHGTYDCVSGTALYALICELLYIPYVIRETKYHVYLLALVDGKKVLIESTDPVHGFVSRADTVQSLVAAYHDEDHATQYASPSPASSSVDWIQLAGLQYFNKALQFYNRRDFTCALSYLNRAMQHYKSTRIISFKGHILQLITEYSNKNT